MKNICKNCGKEYEFEPKRGTYKFQYCSQECKHEYARKDSEPQFRICKNCGKEYWWDGTLKNYEGNIFIDTKHFCSFECGKTYRYEKAKNSTIEKYGAIGFAVKEFREKGLETTTKKYGNSHYNNRDKAKQTCLEKYGVEFISQTKEVKDKVTQAWENKSVEEIEEITKKHIKTNQERYGVNSASQSEEVKQKVKNTNIARYGKESYCQTEEFKHRYKETCIEKYGVEHAMQNPEISNKLKQTLLNKTKDEWNHIIEKRKETCVEKYGVEYASQSKEVKQKIKNTNLIKYGNEVAIRSEKIQNKIKENNLKNYGTEYAIGSEQIQEKIRNTNKEKHGYEYPFQSKELRKIMEENRKKTNIKKYGTENIIQVPEFKEKAIQTCIEKYGVPYNCMSKQCLEANLNTISKINLKFKKRLDNLNINNDLEFCLERQNYDFICNHNILIEINPTYTHNSTTFIAFRNINIEPKDKDYHFNKTKKANQYGYRCIHIWDWDDENKIINLLTPKINIYARNLTVAKVNKKLCNDFLNKYHLQNTCRGQDICLGLYKNTELIQIMTFGKARYNDKYQYELLRLCTKPEYKVIGGAQRLFKHFLKTYNPKSIISYCDNSKFTGEVYHKLNMVLIDYGKPSKHWFNIFTNRHITDNLLRQRGYSQLHNDIEHKKGESNEQLMLEAGYFEVYDCGQSTYVWKNSALH